MEIQTNMREITRMIESGAMASSYGLQEMSTKATTKLIQGMATVRCSGRMEHVTKETG